MHRLTTSSPHNDQSLQDVDMEKCNPVSTPGLQVIEKDLATEEQLPEVLAGFWGAWSIATGKLLTLSEQQFVDRDTVDAAATV